MKEMGNDGTRDRQRGRGWETLLESLLWQPLQNSAWSQMHSWNVTDSKQEEVLDTQRDLSAPHRQYSWQNQIFLWVHQDNWEMWSILCKYNTHILTMCRHFRKDIFPQIRPSALVYSITSFIFNLRYLINSLSIQQLSNELYLVILYLTLHSSPRFLLLYMKSL